MRLSIFVCVLLLVTALFGCKDTPISSYAVGQGSGQINGYVSLRDSMTETKIRSSLFRSSGLGGKRAPVWNNRCWRAIYLISSTECKFTLIFTKKGFAEGRDVDYEYKGSALQYYGARALYQIRRMTPSLVTRPFDGAGDSTATYDHAMFSGRIHRFFADSAI